MKRKIAIYELDVTDMPWTLEVTHVEPCWPEHAPSSLAWTKYTDYYEPTLVEHRESRKIAVYEVDVNGFDRAARREGADKFITPVRFEERPA